MPDGSVFAAKCWGVEELSTEDRLVKIIEAGCDQFGGEALPEVLVELVRGGRVSRSRASTSRFAGSCATSSASGLFDDPYVDPEQAERDLRSPRVSRGRRAGAAALRWCSSRTTACCRSRPAAPLPRRLSAEAAAAYGEVVERPEDADVAIVRRNAPFEPRTGSFIESVFHAGDLDFKEPELKPLLELAAPRPDRPRAPPRARRP